jgi:hypothetical protein
VVIFERINITREIWEREREVKRINIKSKPSEITRIKVVLRNMCLSTGGRRGWQRKRNIL